MRALALALALALAMTRKSRWWPTPPPPPLPKPSTPTTLLPLHVKLIIQLVMNVYHYLNKDAYTSEIPGIFYKKTAHYLKQFQIPEQLKTPSCQHEIFEIFKIWDVFNSESYTALDDDDDPETDGKDGQYSGENSLLHVRLEIAKKMIQSSKMQLQIFGLGEIKNALSCVDEAKKEANKNLWQEKRQSQNSSNSNYNTSSNSSFYNYNNPWDTDTDLDNESNNSVTTPNQNYMSDNSNTLIITSKSSNEVQFELTLADAEKDIKLTLNWLIKNEMLKLLTCPEYLHAELLKRLAPIPTFLMGNNALKDEQVS